MPRKIIPKTRNNSTQTEAAFWGWIRAALRQRSRYWKPIAEARKRARRPYKGTNVRQKWEYSCSICKQWFMDKEVEVDHTIPAGSLRCANDLPGFVERLFCEVEHLQVVCKKCHLKKTKKDLHK